LGLAIAASLCIVTFLAIASSQSRTGPLQVGIRNIRCQSRSADRFSLGTINKPKFYVARKSHFRPGFIARAGIEALDNGVMEGFELKPIEESAVEQAEVTLAEWYLEIQMNDSFDIDDGFTEEAKSFTKAFKARLNADGEKALALTKDGNQHAMISVSGWRLNAIVVSPFEADAKANAEKLLTTLKSKAEAEGEKLDMPVAEQLAPFGLESFA